MSDLVDRLLHENTTRRGLTKAMLTDPLTAATARVTRDILVIVEAALRDEEVPERTIERALRLVIYGTAPAPGELAERGRLRESLINEINRR